MLPLKALRAERPAHKGADDVNILHGEAKGVGQDALDALDPTGGVVEQQPFRSLPEGRGAHRFHRVVVHDGRVVGLVHDDLGFFQGTVGVAPADLELLTSGPQLGSGGGGQCGAQVQLRLGGFVLDPNQRSRCLGLLKGFGGHDRDVLTAPVDDVILQRDVRLPGLALAD